MLGENIHGSGASLESADQSASVALSGVGQYSDDEQVDNSLDLDCYEDIHVGEYIVRNPSTNKKTSFVVLLAGPEHPIRKKQEHARLRKLRQEASKTGKITFDDPADEDRETTIKLVDCILGWSNANFGGQIVEFSRDAAIKLLFDKKKRWLRRQLLEGLDTTDLFIKGCAV